MASLLDKLSDSIGVAICSQITLSQVQRTTDDVRTEILGYEDEEICSELCSQIQQKRARVSAHI
jgi:hypothetical protein